MLTTRRSKRDEVGFFNTDVMVDIMDGERQLGTVVYSKKKMRAALAIDGAAYTVERLRDEPDEVVYQVLLRWLTGRPKPEPNPLLLKDAAGRTLASALRIKSDFAVTRDSAAFAFRKVSRRYKLYREGGEKELGEVGQTKMLAAALHMDFPPEVDAPFQVFLLVVVLDQMARNADTASS